MKIGIWFVVIVILFTLSCTKVSTSPDDSLTEPSNLTLEQIDLESIRLTWQDKSTAEEGFHIDRKICENEWEENYQILPENTTTFVDSELVSIGNYSYRLSAFLNDDFSDTVEASINFLYDDVHSLHSVASQNNVIEFFEFQFALLDSNGIYVQRDYDVWFKLLCRPEGTNLNGVLYNTTDSLSVRSVEGIASVTMYAGNQSGIAVLKCYVYNSNNEEISVIKSNIVIY
ncbi:MAG: fibronectin type III domain-containing protein [Candidatus Cloacimonadota bacterium]|nr:fibronectin type III domain-containing protein [Candidatus Cloacimonadota bacterium]